MSSDRRETNDDQSSATDARVGDDEQQRDDTRRDEDQSAAPPRPPDGSEARDKKPEQDKSLQSDFRMAWDHHTGFVGKIRTAIEKLFHYFFVGCIGLLGLAIALAIPILILGCTAVVLGIPGYIIYQLLGKKEILSPYVIVVTVFWAGYLFTHGWPRLRDGLRSMFQRMRPLFAWVRTMLSSFSERQKEQEEEEKNKQA